MGKLVVGLIAVVVLAGCGGGSTHQSGTSLHRVNSPPSAPPPAPSADSVAARQKIVDALTSAGLAPCETEHLGASVNYLESVSYVLDCKLPSERWVFLSVDTFPTVVAQARQLQVEASGQFVVVAAVWTLGLQSVTVHKMTTPDQVAEVDKVMNGLGGHKVFDNAPKAGAD